MEALQQIRDYAEKAHGNQKRKYSGQPYIVHPEAVMRLCREYTHDTATLAAALLHDVLEDTEVSPQQLLMYLRSVLDEYTANRAFGYVQDLTDTYTKKNYPHLNRKKRRRQEAERLARAAPEAQTVKYADLIDNCLDIVKHDPDFGKVFVQESAQLLDLMRQGNAGLRERALEAVAASRKILHPIAPAG